MSIVSFLLVDVSGSSLQRREPPFMCTAPTAQTKIEDEVLT